MHRPRILVFLLACAAILSFVCLRQTKSQSGLRRITNTTEEGININPSLSGDGKILAFESTEDVAGAGGTDHFRAIRANISVDPPTFFQMGGTRAVAPGISQDGSRIAFASKDDPLGTNHDGNSEIFLFNGSSLLQVTNTSPGDPANRVINGNFQPSISDDGRFVAFSSNRDISSQNGDGNLEIFVYDSVASTFAQLTNSSGIVGFSDAKISGDGSTLACIRDNGTSASTNRDLVKITRATAAQSVLATNVQKLAMTYGRAISDDGARVAYSGETATNSSQVFFYDGRSGNVNRQVTSLGTRSTEVPLHPTISGDGKRIAFATRRPLTGFSNSDASVELYTYDIPTTTFGRITSAPAEADCFDGSNQACEVVSSLNDDGSIVAFNFPRALSGTVTAGLENKSEIYATGTATRPSSGTLTSILNQASLGHEPSSVKAVAPNSIAAAFGTALANSTQQSQPQSDGTFPTNVGGTTVTVNGRSAQIFFVSPARVHFLVPAQTEIGGNAEVVVTNADGFSSRGTVSILRAAPGIFTKTGDGIGEGVILNSDTSASGPFDPSSGNLRLSIFSTGVRNAVVTTVNIAGRVVTPESVMPSPNMPGLDEVIVRVPSDLRGTGAVNLSIQTDGRDSNPVTVTFTGDPSRNVVINEALADPPGTASTDLVGDANHDGVRDSTQDEFVELVNGTSSDLISLSNWTIKTRATGSTTETTRFTFASGTSIPAGEAIVVFGGGGANFNPSDPIFGCAQVVKATTSSGLSLTNNGLTILLRDASGNLIAQFSYGGSTGLDGDNNQSLTRSPDVTGAFVQHTAAAGANGRAYSPGLRTNGAPFGNCLGHPANVTISPPSATANVAETKQFTAQAFDQFGRAMTGVPITFASDNTTVATIDSTSIDPSTGIATANVGTHNPGVAHITAIANDGTTSATSNQSTLTVSGPALSINDVSLNERNSGTTTFTFTVSLSQPAPSGGVKFDIATQDGTATVANNDYVARNLTNQTIAAGQQTYTFDVTVNGDVSIEPTETFFVNVSNVSGASVTKSQGTGTILNDDSPQLSVNDVSANETNSGTTTFKFTVTSTLPAPAGGITFDIATADGTAKSPADYASQSLTNQSIPAGQTTYDFNVTVNGDTLVEPNETFFVNISNVSANAGVTDGQGQGTIQNDDTPNLVISQVYGGGNNSGAPLRNDFVELYNRGATTIDFALTPYSIQYAGVGSNFGSGQTNLTTGTVAPAKYFLIQEGGGTTNGVALPTPDATGSIAMGNTSGKVALVIGTTALAAATCPGDDLSQPFNPSNANLADFVGYGNSASTSGHCYEGAGPAAAPSNTTADFRKAGGCVDTNEDGSDFFTASPNPRNSSSPAGTCQPEITINDIAVTEGNTGTVNATFTVSLSAVSSQTVTVNFATAEGTATLAGNDYQTNSGMLTFNPGVTSQTVTVLVNGDTLDEPNETFFVNLSGATNAVLFDNQGQGTINDNDPTPSLSIDDVAHAEGDSGTTAYDFTVSLSAASGQTVTVNYATADNSASSSSDYQATSGTLTFNPGDTSKTVTVLANGDTTFESSETFFVNLSGAVSASTSDAQGVGTITNDDAAPPTPTFFITNASVSEGNSGTTNAVFDVSLSPASTLTTSVDFATVDGSATAAGNDYQTNSGTLTFNPGDGPKQITVLVNGDILVETNETFTIHLSNATNGAGIGTPDGTGTIQNDDGAAQVVISQVYGGGGNTSSPAAVYKNDFIELFNRGSGTVDLAGWSVQYSSASGTGSWSVTPLCATGHCFLLPGKYFLVQEAQGSGGTQNLPTPDAPPGTIAMATASGKVAVVSNTTPLSGACPSSASIFDRVGYGGTTSTTDFCFEGSGPAPAPSNITADFRKAGGCTDNDQNAADFFVSAPFPRNSASPTNNCSGGGTPNLSIDDVAVAEGNSGTTTATFTVSLSAAAQGADVSFDIATADGTATTANNDYVAKSLTNQIIPAGQTTYSFTVTVNGDTNVEPDEAFSVNVSNVVGANVIDGTGTGTISNDDLPTLSIDDVNVLEGDSGPTTANFTVSLSAPAPAGGVSFTVNTADGTTNPATAGSDYVAIVNGSGNISAGNSSTTVSVTVNGDTTDEPNETFFVNLSNPSNATIADGQGLGTIQNDDSPPTLSVTDVSQAEGNSLTTTFTFTVQLSAPAKAGGVSFTANTADGTTNPANAGSDYVPVVNANGSIPQGSSSTTVTVTVNGDTTFEADETFFVNLTSVTGATVVDAQGLGTITNDDSPPTIAIADTSITEGNSLTSLMTFTVTLTGTSQSNVTVDYATADSSATVADTDYDAANGTLTFAPGDTTKTFTVTIHGDTKPEGDEMFLVNLSVPTGGATISDNQALGTIFLDDPFSVAALNTAYTENFDTLAQSGNSSTTPTAWTRTETGTGANTTYTANNGGSTTGDTYSYGTTGQSDRALGGLRTGSLVPTIGAFYKNDTGSTVNALQISYTGEEWRLGTASRTDQLDFQYSTDATTLATGTWTDVNALDFTTPNTTTTGSKDGNAVGNRTAISSTITGVSIAPGATFWIRWTDFDATGSDDGLAVDDFSLTALNQPTLSIDDLTQAEGNSGTSNFNFIVHLSQAAPAGGVTFNFSTADGTTNPANAGTDYIAVSNGNGSISAGNMQTTVTVQVNGDMTTEPNETFFVNLSNPTNAIIGDGQALGTITNDDAAAPVTKLVISQVYGGGGNTGATYKNDFIEIFNAGNTTVDFAVTPYSVQYTAATGSFGTSKTDISSGTVAPGQYFLIKEFGPASPAGVDLPTPDATGTINLDANSGKVALVLGTTLLSGTCPGDDGVAPFNPSGNGVVDFLGFGFGTTTGNPNCFEGSARVTTASATANARSILRTSSCTDTDNNGADFTYTNSTGTSPPVARNKSTTIPPCL